MMAHAECSLFLIICLLFMLAPIQQFHVAAAPSESDETQHFSFQTENGQYRTEDIQYNNTLSTETATGTGSDITDQSGTTNNIKNKPVEYTGGYSFISDDGYEYTVVYKANKRGFQPYVTAHKIKKD